MTPEKFRLRCWDCFLLAACAWTLWAFGSALWKLTVTIIHRLTH